MRIIIKTNTIRFRFRIPNAMIINRVLLKRIITNSPEISLTSEQIKLIRNELKKLKKAHPQFVLVEIASATGEKFKITL